MGTLLLAPEGDGSTIAGGEPRYERQTALRHIADCRGALEN
jgi:hypothetical protein